MVLPRSIGRCGVACQGEENVVQSRLNPAHRPLQLLRRANGDDSSSVQHDDRVGKTVNLLEVLAREQDRDAIGNEALDDLPQLSAAAGIQPCGGLIEHEHSGETYKGGTEIETSSHPARIRLDQSVSGVGEPQQREDVVGAPSTGLLA